MMNFDHVYVVLIPAKTNGFYLVLASFKYIYQVRKGALIV